MARPRLVAATAAVSTIVTSMAFAPAVRATPGMGVTSQTLAHGTVDGTDYVTKLITIAPGGSTGWHWHVGEVYGLVREGTLTHFDADCSADGVYPAGTPVVEAVGPDHVHVGRNLGTEPLVMMINYVDPTGDPLATDVANPGCGFE